MARRPARPARRRETKIAFDAIAIEGALLQPDSVMRIASAAPSPQLAAEYGLDPGEKLREVVQTKFSLAQSLHARFVGSDKGPVALKRFLTALFSQVFEFGDIAETKPIMLEERAFPIGHQALAGRAPIVFAPYQLIDKGDRAFGDDNRIRSPSQLLQEYLNAQDAALWGLVSDGCLLRLYRDNAALTRPAFIEADLTMMFDGDAPRLADFSAIWLLIHSSRFGKANSPATDCALERWREEARETGARARDELRNGVETALSLFGQGFLAHPENATLRDALDKGQLSPQGYLDALLRLVYRVIFVFAAEDRDLLHVPQADDATAFDAHRIARDIYKRGYGLSRLRDLSSKRHAWDRNIDGWEGVKILFRELWRGQPKLALPALGGLFAPGEVRDFSDCKISNHYFIAAIFHLAWLRTENGLERVNWRDMETEELGSVYESLLELTPNLAGHSGFEFIKVAGHERKTTASYYTPDALVQALLDETLDPLVAERTKGKEGKAAIDALLDLKIIDPACGSGHFLLAAARRLAVKCAQFDRPGAAPSTKDYRHWLREVARRSLYGVDKNPMAIELAKVALWIETVEPGKPLSFLDAHLRCGDSLLGVYDLEVLKQGIPDDAYKALTGDNKAAASAWKRINKNERERDTGTLEMAFADLANVLAKGAQQIETSPEDDLAQVEAKAEAFGKLIEGQTWHRLHTACELYVAAFLMPKLAEPRVTDGAAGVTIPTTAAVREKLAGRTNVSTMEANALHAATMARAFHWPLEFPQIFFAGSGKIAGFDLALGNPPWERIKLQEQEFFASRNSDIAGAANKAERQMLIDHLEAANVGSIDRLLFDEFVIAKRVAEASSVFARVNAKYGGRFALTGTGDVNTYALFTELFATAAQSAGVIVPLGIATDATTAPFFANLVSKCRLKSICAFENEEFIFKGVHHAFRFALLSIGKIAGPTKYSFFLRQPAQISDTRRHFELNPAEVVAINPNTRTAPVFRSKADAELTKQIYARVPVLIDARKGAAGNPWGIEFARLFDMSNDSTLFRTVAQQSQAGLQRDGRDWAAADGKSRYVPLYEAKMIHHYDHRWATYESDNDEDGARTAELAEKADPDYEATPRYWVPESEVRDRLAAKGWTRSWLMGWRDITGIEKIRTVIAGTIPRSAVGNNLPLYFPNPNLAPELSACLLACLSSMTLDFVARHKVGGTHLNFFIAEQLPVLPPNLFSASDLDLIKPRVLELTYTSHSMKPFADDLGYTGNGPFAWDEDRRAVLRAELDAKIAKLYGLTRDQLRYILDPADVYGPDYPSETFRVLKKNDTAKHGEYRTARLVLDAWDRLERGELQ